MHETLVLLGLAITVTVVAGVSRRFGWPAPVLLVAAGVIASYLPGVPRIEINPEWSPRRTRSPPPASPGG